MGYPCPQFTYPAKVGGGRHAGLHLLVGKQGGAPCYRHFRLALRLKNEQKSVVLPVAADLRSWLPGDSLCDAAINIPGDAAEGRYDLEIGILGERGDEPAVRLAIAGRSADGWYKMGAISIER